MSEGRLLWLDMEMTGLDPANCVPLEVAMIVTDDQMNELASYESVVKASAEALAKMGAFVRNMHTENGLLDRVAQATKTVAEVEEELLSLVAGHVPPQGGVLAGNSIWQDRRFIRQYMPRLDEFLHYRMVDVSAIKELVRRWYGESALPEKATEHTAMADIRASIAELAHYRATIFRDAS